MVGKKEVSVVIPVYFPNMKNKAMSDANILRAKGSTSVDAEWVIVETESDYYKNLADIHVFESNKTDPNKSVNRGFAVASGNFVIFLANDVKVCSNWIEKMLACFEQYSDCGLASLGNNEHNDTLRNTIEEGMYFSVCMMKKEDAWLDPQYSYIFDDTDLLFRLHLEGKKFYKNLSGYVEHEPHSTYGKYCGNTKEYERSKEIFRDKYKTHKDDSLFKTFVGEQ